MARKSKCGSMFFVIIVIISCLSLGFYCDAFPAIENVEEISATLTGRRSCSVFATRKNCICSLQFKPLCGSDGITYTNACQFECARRCNEGELHHLFYSYMNSLAKAKVTQMFGFQLTI